MAKGLAVCLLLGVVLQLALASVLNESARKALIKQKYAHLQVEIDEWKRLGKPTQAAFQHDATTFHDALLIDLPDGKETASIFSTDYARNTHFYLFTRENDVGVQVAPNVEAFKDAGWSADRPTKIIAHGFGNTIKSDVFTNLVPALLRNTDCNVIGVDWGKLAKAPFYIEARNHVDGVGKEIAKLIDALVKDGGLDLAKLHILGHSLGAHVAGNAGKHTTSGTVGRITGMDPAMPLFLILKSDRLHREDAELVDVVHTCSGFLGLDIAIGKVDFYPNGGSFPQPGCGLDVVGTCSHGRSYLYMAESAMESNAFPAVECSSEVSASKGECGSNARANMGVQLRYNPNGTGTYYLRTASSYPFDISTHVRQEANEDENQN